MTFPGLALQTSQLNGSSEFLRHDPCTTCGSSDGLAVYDDGHTFCFVCQEWTAGDNTQRSQSTTRMSYQGSAERLKEHLSKPANDTRSSKMVISFVYYHNSSGSPIGAKVRTKNKVFTYEGETDGSFFGQHLFFRNSKEKVLSLRVSLMLHPSVKH